MKTHIRGGWMRAHYFLLTKRKVLQLFEKELLPYETEFYGMK
jgi:hypothetical protein